MSNFCLHIEKQDKINDFWKKYAEDSQIYYNQTLMIVIFRKETQFFLIKLNDPTQSVKLKIKYTFIKNKFHPITFEIIKK